jgi:hypothetical protein
LLQYVTVLVRLLGKIVIWWFAAVYSVPHEHNLRNDEGCLFVRRIKEDAASHCSSLRMSILSVNSSVGMLNAFVIYKLVQGNKLSKYVEDNNTTNHEKRLFVAAYNEF